MRVLLVAGSPEPSSAATLSELAREAETVVAIDRGAEACRAAGIVPDAFCGDADTVSADTLAWVRDHASASAAATTGQHLDVTPADDVRETPQIHGLHGELGIRLFPPAKYDTDLSLGFACARQIASERGEDLEVTVTCASAGRMDHALAVFGVLASNADLAPSLVEDAFTCRILSPRQVDTVLFTEVGAFVFEAKSKRAAVRVTKNFGDIDLREISFGGTIGAGHQVFTSGSMCR